MKVEKNAVMVSFSCRPHSGSEWGVGWNYLLMLSNIYQTLTVYVRNAERQTPWIQDELKVLGMTNVILKPIDDVWLFKVLSTKKITHKALIVFYALWIVKVFLIMIKEREWKKSTDLFHTTWVTDWIWSPLFLLPFKKKIIGPLGSQPANFNKDSSDYYPSKIRFLIKMLLRLNPLNFINALVSDHALSISKSHSLRLPWSLIESRSVISPVYSEFKYREHNGKEKKIFFIGKHLAFKNLDLFTKCVDRLMKADSSIQVVILGDIINELASDLKKLKTSYPGQVTITGKISHHEVNDYLCDGYGIFLQLSSEAGGTAPVEALSCGVPVVCVEGYGVDAFFDDFKYPYTLKYTSNDQFLVLIKEMLYTIWNDYNEKSKEALILSERFSFESSIVKLRQLLYS